MIILTGRSNNMKIIKVISVLLFMISGKLSAQQIGIGENKFNRDASSIFEIRSLNKGFLTPRMKENDRNSTTILATSGTNNLMSDSGSIKFASIERKRLFIHHFSS